jgi:hypothetical protein
MEREEAKNLIETYIVDIIELCPHCGAKAHIEKLWSDHHIFLDKILIVKKLL